MDGITIRFLISTGPILKGLNNSSSIFTFLYWIHWIIPHALARELTLPPTPASRETDIFPASLVEGTRRYGKPISNGILGSTRPLVKKFLGHLKVVKSVGGWRMLCLTEAARIGIDCEAFLQAFKSIREREKHLRAMTAAEKDLGKSFSGKLKSLP